MPASYTQHEIRHRPSTVDAHRKAVEQVIRTVQTQLDDDISLDAMAEMAACSPYHFNRVFREVVGIPPSQFLYALRLQRAKHLLLTTDLSVTEICFEVGYNSLGSFVQRFTELIGVSPTRLRRLAANEDVTSEIDVLCRRLSQMSTSPRLPAVTGRVLCPTPLVGPIFVGLFEQHIPQGRPAGGTVIREPGRFDIFDARPGRYYLCVAGFDRPAHPADYLVPRASGVQVGVSRQPAHVREDHCTSVADVVLRPLALTDPPILIALPLLIAERAEHFAALEP